MVGLQSGVIVVVWKAGPPAGRKAGLEIAGGEARAEHQGAGAHRVRGRLRLHRIGTVRIAQHLPFEL